MRIRSTRSWQAASAALSRQRVVGAALIAVFLAVVGYAGYVVGTPNVNPDSLRSSTTAEGREAGAKAGAKAGYAHGYESARQRAYVPVYAAAYRKAYAREFERAGLDPPARIRVPEPR